MIQRIQTIWLLFASIITFLTINLSFYIGTNQTGIQSYALNGKSNIYFLILTISIGSLSLLNIFLFKNRLLQKKISYIIIFLELLNIVFYCKESLLFTMGAYTLTSLLHIVILFFLVMSIISIKKDEKLLRSNDRLR